MTEFNISRIRYNWRGAWTTGTEYKIDDVIQNNGSSFVCIVRHTSSSLFFSDLENVDVVNNVPAPKWIKMTDGFSWRDQWEAGAVYDKGDLTLYGGIVYLCIEAHVADQFFSNNEEKWTVYSSQISLRSDWEESTRYGVNDVVRYGGIVYRCVEEHTAADSVSGLEADQDKWNVYYLGVDYKSDWTIGTQYKEGDLVKFGGSLYRAKEKSIPVDDSTINFDKDAWELVAPGYQFRGEWNNETAYRIGDVVRHGGWLFYSLSDNFNDNPATSIYQIENRTDPVSWEIITKGINFRGDWEVDNSYKTGDLVRRGGNIYVALLDTEITADGSSLDYLDSSNWELVSEGQSYKAEWNINREYSVGDIAVFYGTAYICKLGHFSDNTNFPSLDIASAGTGFQFWDILVEAGFPGGLRSRGDLLTFDLLRDFYGDDSSFGPTNVSATGNTDRLLSVNDSQSVIYKDYGTVERVFYVSLDGIDDLNDTQRGISQFKPFRTVKFACEQADDGFKGTTTVRVRTGRYDEILPIIVPTKTAIVGDELRSTSIRAAKADTSLVSDRSFLNAGLTRISQIISGVLSGTTVNKTSTNPLNPVIVTQTIVNEIFDGFGNSSFVEEQVTLIPDSQAIGDIQQLIFTIQDYINFHLAGIGDEPLVVGSNQAIDNDGYNRTIQILQANAEFLAREVVEFTKVNFPNYVFNEESRKNDINRFIKAWSYDIIFTGNYKSILEGRYYRNRVKGSSSEDMFYFRDSSGLRNLTVLGLEGILNPPDIASIFRQPTGGAYASLDPGWGPDDDRAWIINRSPYIQNVTTLGTGCIGQKVDGALHNGGNRSIVSNDFTQVIDDGIGAWVLNNGRAELVSVFSYYAHIGYFTTNGGIIRSTNGNNSYGNFGCIASGNDDSETPLFANVNTRNQQASANVFAGDFTDEIQILEWVNAGQHYSQAAASFVGAGVGASVKFEDFRDDAVHAVEIIDSSDDEVQRIGGGGYIRIQNNAQVHQTPNGDLTSITIAANDINTEDEYLGCRIILTSGPGTGQYGYITGYNTATKVINVSRESDDQPGWDHLIPGTPVSTLLTGSTAYRIEPRPIFSAPSYTAENYNLSLSTNWGSIVYGETTEIYNNIAGDFGTGEIIEDDGLIPIAATFNISKIGRTYEVLINDSGAGYSVGDEIIIAGDNLGGSTPTNDLFIKVTAVSNDSTNSIINFTFEGTGASGKFIALTEDGSAGQFSKDGEDWTGVFNMPIPGDWTVLGAGNNRFVALLSNSDRAAFSLNGISWSIRNLPESRLWKSVIYGDDKFVAIASNENSAAYSEDGENWLSATMPTVGDSTLNEWVDITYGKNLFVAVANSQNVAAVSSDGISWSGVIMDSAGSPKDWVSIAYGNNRFVAIASTGEVLYSFNSQNWLSASLPLSNEGLKWSKIRYAQGVFFALAESQNGAPTNIAATSFDGVVWNVRILASTTNWKGIAFGNPYIEFFDSTIGKNTPIWVAINNGNIANRIKTGARAKGRVEINAGVISSVKLWDTGSGYDNQPTLTLISPTATSDAQFQCRLAEEVLTNPSWLNRGLGYRTGSTRVTITGNGFADIIPVGRFVTLENLERLPSPGAQVFFANNPIRYTVVTIQPISDINGNNKARIRVTPELRIRDNLQHNTISSIREKYSQIRITGHDFLDIGTGNFLSTNYPQLYSSVFFSAPEDEVVELDGGRVFYTSTDQSGNFRTGELFAVDQATGIVTLSADFFDLSGLTELRIGGIRVGGSGAVIREFSTDPTFSEDSNNIVPTQRAIKAFLQNRLTLGGSEVATFEVDAGQIRLGGPDKISNTANLPIIIPVVADFSGPDSGISGAILAQNMFFKSFKK